MTIPGSSTKNVLDPLKIEKHSQVAILQPLIPKKNICEQWNSLLEEN